jgi:hypothetical protein
VQQMARAFGVPLTVVDPHRMCAELELRATEPRTLPPSRLALCAELGRDRRWLVSGHRLLSGQNRGRRRYWSPWRKTAAGSWWQTTTCCCAKAWPVF